VNLIQYKDKPVINLDHVRSIRLFVGVSETPRGIEFDFSDGSEIDWLFEDPVETIEVYEKLQATFIHHV